VTETEVTEAVARRTLRIARRFMGPPASGNGGYTSGRLASYVATGQPVQVTLRQPPPLEADLDVEVAADGARAMFGGALIAEAVPSSLEVSPIDPVSFPQATEIATTFAGWASHPFPTCFTCGTDREPPEALGLRPGPVPGRDGTTACPWIPDAALTDDGHTVPVEIVWAALDCPGGWALDLVGRPAVLGRMTAQVDVLPAVGDRCVVMGQVLRSEGRKSNSTTTLYDGEGRVLARAATTWIEVNPRTFNPTTPA
jgi:hypothetical protein